MIRRLHLLQTNQKAFILFAVYQWLMAAYGVTATLFSHKYMWTAFATRTDEIKTFVIITLSMQIYGVSMSTLFLMVSRMNLLSHCRCSACRKCAASSRT